MYSTFHPKAKWKCPYCHVSCTEIHDFSKETWPMRTEDDIAEDEIGIPTSASGKKKHAKEHHGICGTRILPFPRTHIIPCFLHCLSAIVKKLFKLLLRDTQLTSKVTDKWEEHLASLHISLAPKGDARFDQRVKDSRWGRPAWLAILQHHELFISAIREHAGCVSGRGNITCSCAEQPLTCA
jgi:hypothetical protein